MARKGNSHLQYGSLTATEGSAQLRAEASVIVALDAEQMRMTFWERVVPVEGWDTLHSVVETSETLTAWEKLSTFIKHQ